LHARFVTYHLHGGHACKNHPYSHMIDVGAEIQTVASNFFLPLIAVGGLVRI